MIFQKKFKFEGNRLHAIRDDEELKLIDKKEADKAFKSGKLLLDNYLLSNNFKKYKTRSYVRINDIGLLEYIDIQKDAYGSKTFCINFSIMPLYANEKYIILSVGDRLGRYIRGKDVWWDFANDEIAKISFQNVIKAIDIYLIPWFKKYSKEDEYVKILKLKSKIYPTLNEWIDLITIDNKEKLIEESIERLKLPFK